ncbi:hypothetical protein GQ55_7G114500 [Panicum hallii var. hallii]|uniref:Uncharacterized protein n=1 Tax=Panicum hallii var. hallii TaxID=1504633 RepID=A0A2T7CU11_9POAL|nr:hypothetical protein GQ55_7G114500 [Panicum hallii var. hallii]
MIKEEIRGRRRVEEKEELPPYVFSGSYTTTKYTNKQDVGLLSSGRSDLGPSDELRAAVIAGSSGRLQRRSEGCGGGSTAW